MAPYVSFLLPSRKRVEACKSSIEALWITASDKTSFEVLLAFDDDDTESRDAVVSFCDQIGVAYKVITSERHGYKNLHMYYNALCEIASGETLWLWNDDAFMKTESWDVVLRAHSDNVHVLDFKNNHYPFIFPLVPAKYIKTMGHFSLQAHNDTWIEVIFRFNLGLVKMVEDIYIEHARIGNEIGIDYTEVDDDIKVSHAQFKDNRYRRLRLADTNKIIQEYFPDREELVICQ